MGLGLRSMSRRGRLFIRDSALGDVSFSSSLIVTNGVHERRSHKNICISPIACFKTCKSPAHFNMLVMASTRLNQQLDNGLILHLRSPMVQASTRGCGW